MKKTKEKILSIILVLCLVISLFAGCGKKEKKAEPAADTNTGTAAPTSAAGTATQAAADKTAVDTSKRVDLVFYQVGDGPKDMEAVQEKINDILLKKVNATVTFKFTTWTDWTTKYNMILSSGEDCDLIYTANWMQYSSLAAADAFTPLDDLLPKYAPELNSAVSQDSWNQMKVNGKIYSVPNLKEEYTNNGIMYREDLRVKYNLPVPNSLENIEAYMAGIKKNEPSQIIQKACVNSGGYANEFSNTPVLQAKYGWVNTMGIYGLVSNYNTPSQLYNYWASDDFRTDMKMMKKWAEQGFWSKSVLSDSNDSAAFENGQEVIVIGGENAAKYAGTVLTLQEKHPDWKAGFVPYADMNGVAFKNSATGNGTAIPVNSKNPERAMMVLNLLFMDKELNQLIQYGIEGTHYTVDADGYYVNGPQHDNYGAEAANTWNLRNTEFSIPTKADPIIEDVFKDLKTIAAKTNYPDVDIESGFIENYDGYAAERAALSTVMIQYLAPIEAGLVDDVDASIDEFLKKADEAGLKKIQDAYTAQWQKYCADMGYNK